MKSLIALLFSAIAVSIAIIAISLYGYVAGKPGTSPLLFLRWLPGISVALLAGCIGATIEGLLEINHRYNDPAATAIRASSSELVRFTVKPILGSLAGFVLFFAMATGLTSIDFTEIVTTAPETRDPNDGSIGYLLFTMTPRTPGAMSKLIAYSLASGYFYPTLPSLMRLLSIHLQGKKNE
jgi:hypothetical protein